MESILISIKKLLGIAEEYEHFDTDLIIHINSVFSVLTQLGAGPVDGFFIRDKTALWTDFIEDYPRIEMVKTYVYLKVRLVFDPPASSAAIESLKQMINEYEWRIQVAYDSYHETTSDDSIVHHNCFIVDWEDETP